MILASAKTKARAATTELKFRSVRSLGKGVSAASRRAARGRLDVEAGRFTVLTVSWNTLDWSNVVSFQKSPHVSNIP